MHSAGVRRRRDSRADLGPGQQSDPSCGSVGAKAPADARERLFSRGARETSARRQFARAASPGTRHQRLARTALPSPGYPLHHPPSSLPTRSPCLGHARYQAAWLSVKCTCTTSYGKITLSPVRSRTPVLMSGVMSPCTAFTSRRPGGPPHGSIMPPAPSWRAGFPTVRGSAPAKTARSRRMQ
jgi:hypothetical protein